MIRPPARTLAGIGCATLLLAASYAPTGAAQEEEPRPGPAGLPVSIGYEGEHVSDGFPLRLAGPDGDRPAALRLVRGGRPFAVIRPNGRLPDLPAGVYSVVGRGEAGAALFSYRVMDDRVESHPPLTRLVAPATDWPVARGLVRRRFPQGFVDPDLDPYWYRDPSAAAGPAPSRPGVPDVPADPEFEVVPGGRTVARRAAVSDLAQRRMAGVPAGTMGTLRNLDAGAARPVRDADVYVLSGGAVVATGRTDVDGNFMVPEGLSPGVHTLATVSETGAAIIGMRILPDAEPADDLPDGAVDGETEAELVVRPVAFRVRRQGPVFSVAEVPAADLPVALGSLETAPLVGGPPPGGGIGGGGIGGGGAGGAAGGGGLLGALIGAGAGAGIAAALLSDDDDADALATDPTTDSLVVPRESGDGGGDGADG